MVEFLPLIADFVFPGVGQMMGSPAGQAITKALICEEFCNTPIAKTALVCTQLHLPEIPHVPIPTPISLPPRLGGGPGEDWGIGGGGGGGGGCSYFDPCDDDHGGGGGGGGAGGDGVFMCATFPSLAFCGSNGGNSRDRIVIDADIDCDILNNSKFSDIYSIALSRGVTVTELYASYLAKCFKSPLPGFPKITKPVLTVTAPVQNQLVTDTVRVTGYVDDIYAQVKVNGQMVPTKITVLGGAFDVTIAVPVDGIVRVEAADLYMNHAVPIEVVLSSPIVQTRTINNNLFSRPYVIIDEALYVFGANFLLQPVAGFESGMTGVTGGSDFTCVIQNLRVKCWGNNVLGQTGVRRSIAGNFVTIPVQPDLGGDIKQIRSGQSHTCALLVEGSVKCWGSTQGAGLGNGTATSPIPVAVSGLNGNVQSIGSGQFHSCAALNTGEVRCWGQNVLGQLGNGTSLPTLVPVTVIGYNSSNTISLALAGGSSCAQTKDSIKCWGNNSIGTLGDGSENSSFAPVSAVNFSDKIVEGSITSISQHVCAIDDLGMKCWGNNSSYQLGSSAGAFINASNWSQYPLLVDIIGTEHATSISAGDSDTCILNYDEVYCWGQNYGSVPVKYSR